MASGVTRVAASRQTSFRRMIAYSSIAHAGYLFYALLGAGPGRAQAVRAGSVRERRVEVLADQPGRCGGARGAKSIGFEDNHVDAGRGEAGGARASGQPAANDDDIGIELPPQTRVGRTASLGEAVQPKGCVARHRWGLFYPAGSL